MPMNTGARAHTRARGIAPSLTLALALASCTTDESEDTQLDSGRPRASSTSEPRSEGDTDAASTLDADVDGGGEVLDGIWISEAWQLAFVAEAGRLFSYEFTDVSCLPYFELQYVGLDVPGLNGVGHFEQGQWVLEILGTSELRAAAADALPPVCAIADAGLRVDPELSFEVLWRSFDRMYSSFERRGVNWSQQYELQRSRVTQETTDEELFEIACDTIAPLRDPHVAVSWGEQSCDSSPPPEWVDDAFIDAIMLRIDPERVSEDTTLTANGVVAYRWLDADVGYVFLPSMGGFAESPAQDVAAAAAMADEVVTAFAEAKGLIIDIRFNGGGDDAIAFEIANRFADEPRLALSVQTRQGNGWTPRRDYFTHPAGPRQFTQPVILMTSEFTLSSAETFTLAMAELPHVTVFGEVTRGGFSTMMYRNLPNGFGFTVPFESVFAADGESYEAVGVTPDVAVEFDPQPFLAGEDPMLDAALAWFADH